MLWCGWVRVACRSTSCWCSDLFREGMVRYELATPADEAQLRRLLRDNPLPGALSLSLEREPNFYYGATIEGATHQTIVGRDEVTGALAGLASRAVRTAFLNGEATRLGYLGQLRADHRFRGQGHLSAGWARLRELHEAQQDTCCYVTTIIVDNAQARAILERDRPDKPTYRPLGELHTLALWVGRGPRLESPPGLEFGPGRPELWSELAAFLQQDQRRFQCAPCWEPQELADPYRVRGLIPADFLVARRGGRIVGCGALWDQRGFKQSVVRGYAGLLRWARLPYNGLARLGGLPGLPAVGEVIPHAFLSHLAVEGDDPRLAAALVGGLLQEARVRRLSFLMLGLGEQHPLRPGLERRYRFLRYRSCIYLVHWADGREVAAGLDGRPPHLELAVL